MSDVLATLPIEGERCPEAEPKAIRVRHLWHRFGRVDVLRDVSFDVGPGEIYGFIGPNGSGKTTTIRIMATLLEPMAGKVEIEGIDVAIEPDRVHARIGYMADHPGVYDRISVREYLEFFAEAFRVPSLAVVDAVLELTDLRKLQDRLVATMSKGMKQRLQLARILLHDPRVLILDEPASDLDPRARIEIRDLLLDLRSLGKTIFLSSHILTELADVCTSVGILERGRLVLSGPVGEISERLERLRRDGAESSASSAQARAATAAIGPPDAGPARRVKLRVLGSPAQAAALLQGGPGILDVQLIGGVVHVGFVGNDEKIAQIVQHLVLRGIAITGVEPERNELERIFLEVTGGSRP